MEGIYLAFTILQCLSLVCALVLFAVSSALKQSPNVRLNAILAALSSAIVLIGAATNAYDFTQWSTAACWTQGLTLQYLFLAQHISLSMLSFTTFMLIVRRKENFELKYWRYIMSFSLIVPAIIVLVSAMLAERPDGIAPRACWCFLSKPIKVRIFAYTFWYMMSAIPGTILMFCTIFILARHRYVNKLSTSTTKVPLSMIYRLVLFATLYMVIAGMSYIQSLIWSIGRMQRQNAWQTAHPDLPRSSNPSMMEKDSIGFTEFSSCLVGIGMFLIFGTGVQARQLYRQIFKKTILSHFFSSKESHDRTASSQIPTTTLTPVGLSD